MKKLVLALALGAFGAVFAEGRAPWAPDTNLLTNYRMVLDGLWT